MPGAKEWLANRQGELLPVPYFHVVFTLPAPIADWLFGTSDLDRGLIGHLLNGYDTRLVKRNLRGAPRRPDEAAAVPVGAN